MFLPATASDLAALGWDELDIILVTGDSYIDSPFMGIAMIGKCLARAGYRVGIIGQPDMQSAEDIARLGEPRLFWGVSGGAVDSMVANYTALRKRRRSDDYTPGGTNDRRPDRAVIAYANLIRRHFKNTKPIVLGGVEASMRRIAHYDYWSDRIRGSILFDAKADYLVYGMAELATLELARRLKTGEDVGDIRGLCYIGHEAPQDYLQLPDLRKVAEDKRSFTRMFHTFYRNCDPITARGMAQKQDTRFLVHNPPQPVPTQEQMDELHELEFENEQHPHYARLGEVAALSTIRFSIMTHRGCYGECRFCSIGVHQGRTISWRSEDSIVREAQRLTRHPEFKGYITDVGGPTANMYGFECARRLKKGSCDDKQCLSPGVCRTLKVNHHGQTELLKRLRRIKGIKKVFVASGVRHDMVMADIRHGPAYLQELAAYHVSGQLKIAPEHTEQRVLKHMGKPAAKSLLTSFRRDFLECSHRSGNDQYLTYYLIAAHPGCTEDDMRRMRKFIDRELQIRPEQVQIFTPLPSTYSALMYYTERDPFGGRRISVEKGARGKQHQKEIITGKPARRRKR